MVCPALSSLRNPLRFAHGTACAIGCTAWSVVLHCGEVATAARGILRGTVVELQSMGRDGEGGRAVAVGYLKYFEMTWMEAMLRTRSGEEERRGRKEEREEL